MKKKPRLISSLLVAALLSTSIPPIPSYAVDGYGQWTFEGLEFIKNIRDYSFSSAANQLAIANGATMAMTITMSMTAFAGMGSWQKNDTGWWWQTSNGSWPSNRWVWIDGNNDGAAEC